LIAYKIADCPDGVAIPGQFSFPFSIVLPDWLPSSMVLNTLHESSYMAIKYIIAAEFHPTHPGDFSNQTHMWSSYCY
jgi:hypothetical protein